VRQPERGAGDRAIGAGVLYRQEPQLRKGLSLPLLIRASGNQHSIVQAAERAFRLGWGVLAVVYNTRVMTLSLSWRLDRGAALVAVAALLLGVGALLSWSAGGSEILITAASGSHVGQGVDGHPLSGSHLLVLGEEAEEGDKGPVNAVLLTALLLASLLGMTAGGQLAYDRRQPAPCLLCIPGHPSFEAAREDAPFLSVFRL
jgi:hypothetical protein